MESFMKSAIVNGMTGSSWRFKRFKRLYLISAQDKNLLAKEKNGTHRFWSKSCDDNSDEELSFPKKLNDDSGIDNSVQEKRSSPSFYRFINQTWDPLEALNDSSDNKIINLK